MKSAGEDGHTCHENRSVSYIERCLSGQDNRERRAPAIKCQSPQADQHLRKIPPAYGRDKLHQIGCLGGAEDQLAAEQGVRPQKTAAEGHGKMNGPRQAGMSEIVSVIAYVTASVIVLHERISFQPLIIAPYFQISMSEPEGSSLFRQIWRI